MLLLLMLAFAYLFVPGLLLLQMRKAWVVTVSSTYHRHTVCTPVSYTHLRAHET